MTSTSAGAHVSRRSPHSFFEVSYQESCGGPGLRVGSVVGLRGAQTFAILRPWLQPCETYREQLSAGFRFFAQADMTSHTAAGTGEDMSPADTNDGDSADRLPSEPGEGNQWANELDMEGDAAAPPKGSFPSADLRQCGQLPRLQASSLTLEHFLGLVDGGSGRSAEAKYLQEYAR